MDALKNTLGGLSSGQSNQQGNNGKQDNNLFSSITDKINNAAGGGKEGEKKEDALDKGIDYAQEKFLGQGPQDNESAIEQAKDEQIANFIRDKYKSTAGSDFPLGNRK